MKPTSLLLAVSLSLAATLSALADQPSSPATKPDLLAKASAAKKQKAKPVKKAAPKPRPAATRTETVVLTGSYIPRQIHRNGIVTDGPDNVVVLDYSSIRESGGVDLPDVLFRKGLSR